MLAVNDARPFWGAPGAVAGRWRHAREARGARGGARGGAMDGAMDDESVVSVVTMNGHPSYEVGRHPAHGGVYMQSCWCVWTGFAMAPRGADAAMEDAALELTADDPRQARDAARYNRGVAGLGF